MSNLHSNNDIRCGLIMSVKINTAYVEYLYKEREGYEGELKYIGKEDYEDDTTSAFWDEFSMKYNDSFEAWLRNHHQDHDEELCYLFQEHLEDWKDNFIWFKEDEEDSDSDEEEHYCGHLDHIYGCRCDEEEEVEKPKRKIKINKK